jgi:hypothetical protein
MQTRFLGVRAMFKNFEVADVGLAIPHLLMRGHTSSGRAR